MRFVATTRAPLNVQERYAAKLSAKAKAEGHASVDELREAYREKIEQVRIRDVAAATAAVVGEEVPGAGGMVTEGESGQICGSGVGSAGVGARPPPPAPALWPQAKADDARTREKTKVKRLDQILNVSKAAALPVPELTAIWRLRHASNPQSLCAVMPASTYHAMEALARQRPLFVLPVPRGAAAVGAEGGEKKQQRQEQQRGAEIHFLQWTFDAPSKTSTVLFTHLAEYKLRAEYAVPHTTMTHHADFAGDKGVVLMEGQVVEGKGVSTQDARWLAMCLQRFYGAWGNMGFCVGDGGGGEEEGTVDVERLERARQRRLLLEWFGTGDHRFTLEKLMEEAERIG